MVHHGHHVDYTDEGAADEFLRRGSSDSRRLIVESVKPCGGVDGDCAAAVLVLPRPILYILAGI
jgi:hypothetical protein